MTREELTREREASLARRRKGPTNAGPSALARQVERRFGHRDFGHVATRVDHSDDYVPPADLTAVPKRGKRRKR